MGEDRLAELEMQLAFQDNTIQELNAVVIRQQEQIDQLLRELELIKDKLRDLKSSSVVPQSEETPPPHY